jgi:EpsI family protein
VIRTILIITLLILLGGSAGWYLRYVEAAPNRAPNFGEIPMQEGGYFGDEHRFSEDSYEILQADTSTLRLYTDDDGSAIWLFIGYFASQKYGSQIHSPKHCLPGGGWKIAQIEPYDLKVEGAGTRRVNRLIIADRDRVDLMFYWYETRGGAIQSEFGLKWDLMMNSLRLRPTDAAIVRINLPLRSYDDIPAGTERALRFLRVYLPAIEKALPFSS